MNKNTSYVDQFVARINGQATSSHNLSEHELRKKILERVLAYADMKAPQYYAIMSRGLKNELQYVAYMCALTGIPYDMSITAAEQKYGSNYSSKEELVIEFNEIFPTVEYDEEWTKSTFEFLINPNAAPKFPPVSFTSMVNGMNLKEAEMTMKALLGGWNRFCKLVEGEKQFYAMKRAFEMYEYGFSSSYVSDYLTTLVDGSEIKAEDVPEMTSVSHEAAVRMGKLNKKKFNFGARYK